MMIDCDRATELISESLDGPLSQEDRRALDEHLAVCGECRALLSDLTRLGPAWESMSAPVPEGFAQGVMDRVGQEKVVPLGRASRRRWRSWAATAAVFAVVLFSAGTLGQDYLDGLAGGGSTGATPDAGAGSESADTAALSPPEAAAQTREGAGTAQPETAAAGDQQTENSVQAAAGGGGTSAVTADSGQTEETEPEYAGTVPAETPAVSAAQDGASGHSTQAGAQPFLTPAAREEAPPAIQPAQNAAPSPAPLTEEEALAVLEDYLEGQSPSATLSLYAAEEGSAITAAGLSPNGAYYTFQVQEAGGEDITAYAVSLDGSTVLCREDRSLLSGLTPEDPGWEEALAAYQAEASAYDQAIGQ